MRCSNRVKYMTIAAAGLLLPSCAAHKLSPPSPAVVAASPDVRRLAAANTDFAFRLLPLLVKDAPTGNVFFSPFSISQALTLTLVGAGGQTRTGMAQALGLTAMPQDQINAGTALLLPSLENPDPAVEVSVANALWANRGVTFAPQFQADAGRFFGAQAATLDFSAPSSADTINAWVAANTQGKITQIVSASDLAAATAVLTNAVYFHGKWQKPFDKAATQDGPFFLAPGRPKAVPLMTEQETLAYLDTPQFQAVRLPYGTGRMALDVYLPKPGVGLDTLVGNFSSRHLSQWTAAMTPTTLTLVLPRFKAEYQKTLNVSLTVLGMGQAFSLGADFGPMGLPGNHLSAVIHKAVLDVDEEGTTAAAATAGIATASIAPEPTTVRVDRPFVCLLRDSTTGTVLFAGVIRDPQ